MGYVGRDPPVLRHPENSPNAKRVMNIIQELVNIPGKTVMIYLKVFTVVLLPSSNIFFKKKGVMNQPL